MAEEDCEFVSADARHNRSLRATPACTGPDAGAQPSRDIDEQFIACCMSEAVVDHLELVEGDEQDGEVGVLLTGGFDRGLEAVDEIEAVWEASERIDDFAFSDVRLR